MGVLPGWPVGKDVQLVRPGSRRILYRRAQSSDCGHCTESPRSIRHGDSGRLAGQEEGDQGAERVAGFRSGRSSQRLTKLKTGAEQRSEAPVRESDTYCQAIVCALAPVSGCGGRPVPFQADVNRTQVISVPLA